jgi:alcohol dehydrogenase YqhD (iron-dependent ADH family)
MENFTYSIPTKVYFGKGQIKNLAAAIKEYGNKILIAYGGGSIKKLDYMMK